MKNVKGFTLIELVIVIVIMGIISAVAVPKFLDITSEAKESSMEATYSAVNTSMTLFESKVHLGELDNDGQVNIDGLYINIADNNLPFFDNEDEIRSIMNVSSGLDLVHDSKTGGFTIQHEGKTNEECMVKYVPEVDTNISQDLEHGIFLETKGC